MSLNDKPPTIRQGYVGPKVDLDKDPEFLKSQYIEWEGKLYDCSLNYSPWNCTWASGPHMKCKCQQLYTNRKHLNAPCSAEGNSMVEPLTLKRCQNLNFLRNDIADNGSVPSVPSDWVQKPRDHSSSVQSTTPQNLRSSSSRTETMDSRSFSRPNTSTTSTTARARTASTCSNMSSRDCGVRARVIASPVSDTAPEFPSNPEFPDRATWSVKAVPSDQADNVSGLIPIQLNSLRATEPLPKNIATSSQPIVEQQQQPQPIVQQQKQERPVVQQQQQQQPVIVPIVQPLPMPQQEEKTPQHEPNQTLPTTLPQIKPEISLLQTTQPVAPIGERRKLLTDFDLQVELARAGWRSPEHWQESTKRKRDSRRHNQTSERERGRNRKRESQESESEPDQKMQQQPVYNPNNNQQMFQPPQNSPWYQYSQPYFPWLQQQMSTQLPSLFPPYQPPQQQFQQQVPNPQMRFTSLSQPEQEPDDSSQEVDSLISQVSSAAEQAQQNAQQAAQQAAQYQSMYQNMQQQAMQQQDAAAKSQQELDEANKNQKRFKLWFILALVAFLLVVACWGGSCWYYRKQNSGETTALQTSSALPSAVDASKATPVQGNPMAPNKLPENLLPKQTL